jgi:hypothetical protein
MQRTPEHRIPTCTEDVGALERKVKRTAQMPVNCKGEAVVVTTGCYAVSAGTRFQTLRRA